MSNPLDAVRAKSSLNTKELRKVIFDSTENFEAIVAYQKKEAENGLIPDVSFFELSRYDQQDYLIKHTQKHRKIMNIDMYTRTPP